MCTRMYMLYEGVKYWTHPFTCNCFSLAVSGGMGGRGWGLVGMQQAQPPIPEQQKYEAMFNSLFPVNGMVTGI